MTCEFVSVSELDQCNDITLEHYIPKDDDTIEAYDIRFTKGTGKTYEWVAEWDIPIWAAKKIYVLLKEQLEKDGYIK